MKVNAELVSSVPLLTIEPTCRPFRYIVSVVGNVKVNDQTRVVFCANVVVYVAIVLPNEPHHKFVFPLYIISKFVEAPE